MNPGSAAAALLRGLLAFACLALPVVLLAPRGEQFGFVDPHDEATSQAYGMATYALGCVLVFAMRWLLPTQVPMRPARAGAVLARYLPAVVVWCALLAGYVTLMQHLGAPVARQMGLDYVAKGAAGRPAYWVVAASVVLFGPLAEEIVFRGYVQEAVETALPRRRATLVTAALFGLVHGLPYALPIGLLGLFFGWLRARYGSLLAPTVAHATHNLLTLVLARSYPPILDWLFPQ